MKRLTCGALFASIAFMGSAQDDELVLVGEVVNIVDGDTADMRLDSGDIRVRLHGVDAPEREQPYGSDAKALLAELVEGRAIELQVVTQDRYDRIVGRIYVGGVDANAELIKRGAAMAERCYLRQVEDGETYCHHEHAARASRLGIWRLLPDQRIAPWQWRDDVRPFTDYTNETAEACIAAIGASRAVARQSAQTPARPDGAPLFTCDVRKTCQEIATCDEAMFRLRTCGATSLDRDKDGVPCEDICR